jgi:hypothetical protein
VRCALCAQDRGPAPWGVPLPGARARAPSGHLPFPGGGACGPGPHWARARAPGPGPAWGPGRGGAAAGGQIPLVAAASPPFDVYITAAAAGKTGPCSAADTPNHRKPATPPSATGPKSVLARCLATKAATLLNAQPVCAASEPLFLPFLLLRLPRSPCCLYSPPPPPPMY